MCGIVVGMCFGQLTEEDEKIRQRVLRYLTSELLLATEDRGKDATGATVLFDDLKFFGVKRGQRVSDFISKFGESPEYYGSFLKVWNVHPANAKIYLGHCRAGTIGDKEENENNHPIKIGNIVGIHNGKIENHNVIFTNLKCKRDGKVDSEAIFRLFEHYTNKGKEPFTMDMLQTIADRIQGQYAITLFNADNTEQLPIMRDGRPVELILIRSLGILLAISELKFWSEVHFRYERLVYYHKDIHDQRIKSLLSKDNIVKKMMEDDSAFIFDLSTKVTPETEISDLGVWQKISRSNKIWKSVVVGTGSSYGNNWMGSHHNGRSGASSYSGVDSKAKAEDTARKRRVFDNITKCYVIKAGDKILKDDKAVLLPVGPNTTDASKTEPAKQFVTIPNKDDKTQQPTDKLVNVEDSTVYQPDNNKDNADNSSSRRGSTSIKAGIIDIDPNDIKTVVNGSMIEVDMEQIPVHVVEAAQRGYSELDKDRKGYITIEEIAEAAEFKDASMAESLGIVVVANRLFRVNWKNGFMAGYMQAQKTALHQSQVGKLDTESLDKLQEKQLKTEKHIAGLKSLVLLLSRHFNTEHGKDGGAATSHLASIALVDGKDKIVDIDNLVPLFNSYEKNIMFNVKVAIEKAKSSKSAESSNKEDK